MATGYDHDAHAASFGAAAEAYEAGRPSYPGAAVDWLVPAGAARVLDLGAGTGKLTAQLAERGLDVLAVEPSQEMRAYLAQVVPAVVALAGSAEEIPLPDASVDALVVAQAWYWVDPTRALPEVARVLRPGGHLALVWNVRLEDAGWTGVLGEVLRSGSEGVNDALMGVGEVDLGELFTPAARHQVVWTHRASAEQVVDMVASRSYVITLPPARREALLERVRGLLASHPDTTGAEQVEVPYVTYCHRAQRA